jgi:hypothetical protein
MNANNFRVEYGNDRIFESNKFSVYGLSPSKVKFDYGLKTFSFALSIDDAEANYLVNLINDYLK